MRSTLTLYQVISIRKKRKILSMVKGKYQHRTRVGTPLIVKGEMKDNIERFFKICDFSVVGRNFMSDKWRAMYFHPFHCFGTD